MYELRSLRMQVESLSPIACCTQRLVQLAICSLLAQLLRPPAAKESLRTHIALLDEQGCENLV